MSQKEIATLTVGGSIKAVSPKGYVMIHGEGVETLFSYGTPVVHREGGKTYFDPISWACSKTTLRDVKAYTGEDREAITEKLKKGEYELAFLKAPEGFKVNLDDKAEDGEEELA